MYVHTHKSNFVCIHYVDEDIESAVSECEQLVQAGQFSSQFLSSYSITEYSDALILSPPAPPPPCYPGFGYCPLEVIEVEEVSQLANGELNKIFRLHIYLERERVIL